MIATAWVDTTEGRRKVIGLGAKVVLLGILGWTIGRLVHPWIMWGGIGIFLFGTVVIVRALVHTDGGLPVRVFPSKPCVVPGCVGTMHFLEALKVPDAPHTLEWSWRPSWRCAKDSAHVQLIAKDEERQIVRSFHRRAEDSAEDRLSEARSRHSSTRAAEAPPPTSPPRV